MPFVPICPMQSVDGKSRILDFVVLPCRNKIGTIIKTNNMTFAIIKTGGKQYKVQEGDTLSVEKLEHKDNKVVFDEVLLWTNDKDIKVGKPFISGAKVEAKVIEDGKEKKKLVFRYKSKTRQRKKKGHRQPYTKVQITKITS